MCKAVYLKGAFLSCNFARVRHLLKEHAIQEITRYFLLHAAQGYRPDRRRSDDWQAFSLRAFVTSYFLLPTSYLLF